MTVLAMEVCSLFVLHMSVSPSDILKRFYAYMMTNYAIIQWRSEGPQGLKEPARGPPGRSSRRNPLARGPKNLFAGMGGPKIVATLLLLYEKGV